MKTDLFLRPGEWNSYVLVNPSRAEVYALFGSQDRCKPPLRACLAGGDLYAWRERDGGHESVSRRLSEVFGVDATIMGYLSVDLFERSRIGAGVSEYYHGDDEVAALGPIFRENEYVRRLLGKP